MEILKNIANLFKVKTIVTLVVIAIFAVLALRGDIPATEVMIIISMVVSFYFGTQHEKTTPADELPRANAEAATMIASEPTAAHQTVDSDTYAKIHPDSK